MAIVRKLQVFVSSTYTDLLDERQAAVQAILSTGHIPAGMELFAAGDQSQMDVIQRWISESDVFLLILGGRYGSIEPKSGKSYVEREYRYAAELGKPSFALVIQDDALERHVKSKGRKVIETDNSKDLKTFREHVLTKLVKFWADTKDIKLAIHETLSDFARREELVGWVRGDNLSNAVTLAEEVARLAQANEKLRSELAFGGSHGNYTGLNFDELLGRLEATSVTVDEEVRSILLRGAGEEIDLTDISLLYVLMALQFMLAAGVVVGDGRAITEILRHFILLDLVKTEERAENNTGVEYRYQVHLLTNDGKRFLNQYSQMHSKLAVSIPPRATKGQPAKRKSKKTIS